MDSFKAAGIETVFGIISVHNIPIFDAIAREGGVRLVPARTEAGAADELCQLAERIGAGVITSAAGRGSLSEEHPQCIGFFPVDAQLA